MCDITELTVWLCNKGHSHTVSNWYVFVYASFSAVIDYNQSAELWNPTIPELWNPTIPGQLALRSYKGWIWHALTTKFRGSTPRTGQTWRGWISILVRQRCPNYVSLGALHIFHLVSFELSLAKSHKFTCLPLRKTVHFVIVFWCFSWHKTCFKNQNVSVLMSVEFGLVPWTS